jgi:hypothetical protein
MGVKDITEISKQCLDDAGDKVKAVEKALSMLSVGKSIEEIQASTGLSEREILELQGDF